MLVNIVSGGGKKEEVSWRPMWKARHAKDSELTCVACHVVDEANSPVSEASILLGFSDGVVESWLCSPDAARGDPKMIRRMGNCGSPIRSVSMNRMESFAVTTSDDGVVRVWDHQGTGNVCSEVETNQGVLLAAALMAPNVLVTCHSHSPVLTVWHLQMKQAVLLLGWPADAERPQGNAAGDSSAWTYSASAKAKCSAIASCIATGNEAGVYVWRLSNDVIKAVDELVPPSREQDTDAQQPSADDGVPALLGGMAQAGSGLKLTLRPLLIAASSGRTGAVRKLLRQGAQPGLGIDSLGNTSLHLAALYERWPVCSELARACTGMPQLLAKTNKAGMTILHIAAPR
jgi:WD40 repeat protein